VLGEPVPGRPGLLGGADEGERGGHGLRAALPGADGDEIEDGESHAWESVPPVAAIPEYPERGTRLHSYE